MKKLLWIMICCCVLVPAVLGGCKSGGSAEAAADPRKATLAENLTADPKSEFPFRFEGFRWLETKDNVMQVIRSRGISEDKIEEIVIGSSSEAESTVYVSTREKNPFQAYRAGEMVTVYEFGRRNGSEPYKLVSGNYYFTEPDEDTKKADCAVAAKELAALPGLPEGETITPDKKSIWFVPITRDGEQGREGVAVFCPVMKMPALNTSLAGEGEILFSAGVALGQEELQRLTGK